MSTSGVGQERGASSARDAWLALRLFALAPHALGGVSLRAGAGPVRDRWLADLRAALAPATPWRPCPLNIDLDRLLGGIDLAATLQAGRSVAQRGLLAEADGGVVVLAMAERTSESAVAYLAAALDRGEVAVARDGIEARSPARFGIVALDEGADADEGPREALLDRLAFHVDLGAVSMRDLVAAAEVAAPIDATRPAATLSDDLLEALCGAALALGALSLRASLLAARVASLLATLDGRTQATADDASAAARLVLGPRATRVPAPPADSEADEAPKPGADANAAEAPPAESPEPAPASDTTDSDATRQDEAETEADGASASDNDADEANAAAPELAGDVVLAAASAAIPAGLLARLVAGVSPRGARSAAGRAGAAQSGTRLGRPAGVRRARPRGGARLDLIATLRAAAPWQRVRQREAAASGSAPLRVRVRADDFHVGRRIQRGRTVTIFAVDASGSSALQRLAEAKGAVELLLAECYVRRDSVAVIAFRGRGSELLLPPTRSLVRAKRSLAELPGGGGTPLAAGIDAALALALAVQRKGDTPVVVVLTDGRANVARSGGGGRAQADADASLAAQALAASGLRSLLIDTSPQPQAKARELAVAMRAHYLPLPYAGADVLSSAVRAVAHGEALRQR